MAQTFSHESLNERLAAMPSRLPAGAQAVMARTVAHIAAVAPGLPVGASAPDFVLPDPLGRPVSLAARLAAGPVVLTFFRGAWCPYCSVALRALDARVEALRELGASLLAVSPQAPEGALSLVERHALRFDVLSDARQEAIAAYRLGYDTPLEQQALVKHATGLDLVRENANGTWGLPATATFVIDRSATIVAAGVTADPRERMEPEAVLAAVRAVA